MEDTEQNDTPAVDQPLPQADTEPKKNATVEDARGVVDRMEKANAEAKLILERQESLAAERIVSGNADAGQVDEPPKEETPEEYSARVVRGELKDEEGKLD